MTPTSDKRTAIIEAAMALVAENGFHATPTSTIAQRAGVGVGTIYRYFANKDDLIHAIYDEIIPHTSRAILKGFNPTASLREQFIQLSVQMQKYFIENETIFLFSEQYFNSPFGIQRRQQIMFEGDRQNEQLHPMSAIFRKAKEQGIFKDLPRPMLGALTYGPIVFAVRDIRNGLLEYTEKTLLKVAETIWDALKR